MAIIVDTDYSESCAGGTSHATVAFFIRYVLGIEGVRIQVTEFKYLPRTNRCRMTAEINGHTYQVVFDLPDFIEEWYEEKRVVYLFLIKLILEKHNKKATRKLLFEKFTVKDNVKLLELKENGNYF